MTKDEDNKDKADSSHRNSELKPEDKKNPQLKNVPTITEPVINTPDDVDFELMSIPILTNKIEADLDIDTDPDDQENEKP